MIRLLLENGADPNLPFYNGYCATDSPLHCAVESNRPDIVDALLEHKVNVNSVDNQGCTPLFRVVSGRGSNTDKIVIMQKLLAHGAEVRAQANNGETPLHSIARLNCPEAVQMLLDRGADINALDEEKNNALFGALFGAVFGASLDTVEFLLHRGIGVNEANVMGETALHIAASFCRNSHIIEVMLNVGANPRARDKNNDTPLHRAVSVNNVVAVKVLLEVAPDTLRVKNNNEKTPIDLAEEYKPNCPPSYLPKELKKNKEIRDLLMRL